MSTVVKENQVLTSIPETATARPVASSTAGASDASARPQPVALEVAVAVNGARTVAGSDKREPFSESTKTVLIYGHGAVVRLTSSVAPGQLLFLTNEKTKKEVVCQVVKSKNYHNVSGYVELEFTEPVAGFWGMRFPASGAPQSSSHSPAVASSVAPSATPVAASVPPPAAQKAPASVPANESRSAASGTVALPDAKFAAPVAPRVSTPMQATPSISSSQTPASSQQNVSQTASTPASATSSTHSIGSGATENAKTSKVVEISRTKPAVAEQHITSAKASTAASNSILDSDEVKMPSWLDPLARNAAASSAAAEADAKEQSKHHDNVLEEPDLAITEISAVPEAANVAVAAPSFGSRLLTDESDNLATSAGGSSKKFLIVGIAAGLLLLIGGGAWYMRQTAGTTEVTASTPALNSAAANGNSTQTTQPAQVSAPSQSNPSGTITTAAPVPATTGASSGSVSGRTSSLPEPVNASLKTKDAATNVVSAAPAPRAKKPTLGEVNLSAPIVNSAGGRQPTAEEGLNLEGSNQLGATGNLSSGLAVSKSKQPVAPPVPLPIGGDVKAARLISSVPPVYPPIARSQRIGGNVQIDALVDANGHISSMKVVSGPPLLQQSAMEALRHWKYEPAQLNGNPVATHLSVTIQFKIQ